LRCAQEEEEEKGKFKGNFASLESLFLSDPLIKRCCQIKKKK
jgi:hypothetical protein